MKVKMTIFSPSVIDLYSAELMECHRLLDIVGIPKSGFDEQLSISQRVRIAVQQLEQINNARASMVPL